MYRTIFCILWERVRVGWFGRMTLKHVYYHMWKESPVQVWCITHDARGWFTGMTQTDDMGREVGGGFRIGNTCTPVVDPCQCMAKPIQYCKLKINKWRQIGGKKRLSTNYNGLWLWFDPWVAKTPRRMEWLPSPVFLPRKSYEQKSLVGHSTWGCKQLDTTERLTLLHTTRIFKKGEQKELREMKIVTGRMKLFSNYGSVVNLI